MSITSSILNYLSRRAAFNNPMMSTGYLISFEPRLPSDDDLIEFFSSLFDIKKLAIVSRKKKEVEKVALILGSSQNAEMLSSNDFMFKESRCNCESISPEKADELIVDNRTKLYVGSIPCGVDNVLIWNHFARFGILEYSFIIKKPSNTGKKGFGFVTFKTRASLLKALTAKNYIMGKKLVVSEFSCKSRGKKKSQQANKEIGSDNENKLSSYPLNSSEATQKLDIPISQRNYYQPWLKTGKNLGMQRPLGSPNYGVFQKDTSQLLFFYPEEQRTEPWSWFRSPKGTLARENENMPPYTMYPQRCLARRPTSDKFDGTNEENALANADCCKKKNYIHQGSLRDSWLVTTGVSSIITLLKVFVVYISNSYMLKDCTKLFG